MSAPSPEAVARLAILLGSLSEAQTLAVEFAGHLAPLSDALAAGMPVAIARELHAGGYLCGWAVELWTAGQRSSRVGENLLAALRALEQALGVGLTMRDVLGAVKAKAPPVALRLGGPCYVPPACRRGARS